MRYLHELLGTGTDEADAASMAASSEPSGLPVPVQHAMQSSPNTGDGAAGSASAEGMG